MKRKNQVPKNVSMRIRAWLQMKVRSGASLGKRNLDADMDEEMRSHVALRTQANVEAGMDPEEARFAALRQFGWTESIKETCRDQRGTPWVRTFFQDVRYAFRTLRNHPSFAAVVVLTLALGIGANTAIFTLVNGVLLKPLPLADPDQLVWAEAMDLQTRNHGGSISPPDFADYRQRSKSMKGLAAFISGTFSLTGSGEPEMVRGARVAGGFFETLGVAPMGGGRTLQRSDETRAAQIVVLSEGLWKRRFGGDPAIVGKTIQVNDLSATVVGVMPAPFSFPAGAELWRPLPLDDPNYQIRRFHFMNAVGRLAPGTSLEQAQAEADQISRALERDYPDSNTNAGFGLTRLADHLAGESKTSLLLLTAAVGLLLLVSCANIANLVFVRGLSKSYDYAVRAALGASRWRIASPLIAESLLLAAVGGGLGLGVAWIGVHLLLASGAMNLPQHANLSLDWAVLAYASTLSCITGLLFGLGPAFAATRPRLLDTIKGVATGSADSRRQGFQRMVVVGQAAMSLMLLCGAVLLGKSLWHLVSVRPGFEPSRVLSAQFALSSRRYQDEGNRRQLIRGLIERVERLPGVIWAGTITEAPLSGLENDTGFSIPGREVKRSEADDYNANQRVASPDYFRTMSIPVLRGRTFTENDTTNSPQVIVVSDTLAKRFFPNQDPIGQRMTIDFGDPWTGEIIGVVGNIRHSSLAREPYREFYTCVAQRPPGASTLVVRAEKDPRRLTTAICQQMRELDPSLPLFNVKLMDDLLSQSLAQPRFRAALVGLFAGAALLLVMIGIYGVAAQSVALRTRELGIRMALGAQSGDVLALILGQAVRLTIAGGAIGLAAGLALRRTMAAFLFDVSPADPVTFASVFLLLFAASVLASWIPARRAVRINPVDALRTS